MSNPFAAYGSGSESDDDAPRLPKLPNCAPTIVTDYDVSTDRAVDISKGEIVFNPTATEIYMPEQGPKHPERKTQQAAAERNMLAGYAEKEHISDFAFETQRKTYHSYGYAVDPSRNLDENGDELEETRVISQTGIDEGASGNNIWQSGVQRKKRKRNKNDDTADIDNWQGPWAKYQDEKTNEELAAKGEDREEMDAMLKERAERKAIKRQMFDDSDEEVDTTTETSTLHVDGKDYQGRCYINPPHDVDVILTKESAPDRCFLPKKLIHTYKSHTKAVTSVEQFPLTGHLLLSSSMDGKVKIWETYGKRRLLRTYCGHNKGVRCLDFTYDGKKFMSGAYDRLMKLWDTETGQCIQKFSNKKMPYVIRIHPNPERQHMFLVGSNDKKVSAWDCRSGNIVQQYDRHLNPVNTITFIDNNRRFVTTSDDKSIRVWEWNIPVDFKYIADPGMHSMPAMTKSPDQNFCAATSLDNKISIFDCSNGKFRPKKKKEFRSVRNANRGIFQGHIVAGYACRPCFSPDQSYLCSGDAEGKMFIWDWKTGRLYSKFQAHDQVVIDCKWLYHETSKLVTASWDGKIKLWD